MRRCKKCGNELTSWHVIHKRTDMWMNVDSQYQCPKCKNIQWSYER